MPASTQPTRSAIALKSLPSNDLELIEVIRLKIAYDGRYKHRSQMGSLIELIKTLVK